MIRCIGYLKSLKQYLFTLLISCFILLGGSFVNGYYQSFDLNLSEEINNSTNYFTFLSYGNLSINGKYYLFQVEADGYLDTFFWSNNGLYYLASDPTNRSVIQKQGYFRFATYCDYIGNTDGIVNGNLSTSNCSNPSDFTSISGNYNVLHVRSLGSNAELEVYFDDTENKKILIFQSVATWSSLGLTYNPLVSEDLSTLNNYITYSPFGEPPIIEDPIGDPSESVNIDNTITGDYYYSNCTYKQIFDYAESNGYSEYLCYGGLDNFNLYDSSLSYNPTPGTGKTLGQILSYSNAWNTPQDRFTFWNGLYIDRYNSNYNAIWESYPAVYRTWFDLYYRFGGSSLIFDSVREYCAMKSLDIDFNTTLYKGKYFKNTCDYIKNNGQYPYNGTGDSDNVVGVNWIGVGNMGSGVNNPTVSSDPTKFIQDFFNKLKENLPTRYDLGGGFLPLYIITFMCAVILFRFLSH